MGIGCVILINGILGAIVYIPAVWIFQKIMYHKYGKDIANNGFDDAMHQSDIGYQYMSGYDDTKIPKYKAVSWILTMLFWEFVLPVIFTGISQAIKERHDLES